MTSGETQETSGEAAPVDAPTPVIAWRYHGLRERPWGAVLLVVSVVLMQLAVWRIEENVFLLLLVPAILFGSVLTWLFPQQWCVDANGVKMESLFQHFAYPWSTFTEMRVVNEHELYLICEKRISPRHPRKIAIILPSNGSVTSEEVLAQCPLKVTSLHGKTKKK